MRLIYLLLVLTVIISLDSFSQSDEWLWATDYFSSHYKASEVSGDGFMVSGSYISDSTITDPPLAYYPQSNNAFITKYDSNGDWLWYKSYGYNNPNGYSFCQQSIEVPSGNIYALFKMVIPYIFEIDTFLWETGPSREDLILAKYDNNGTLIWSERVYPEMINTFDGVFPFSICCDNAENIYLNCNRAGALNIGDTLLSQEVTDMLCKFDSAGELKWFINYSNAYCELDYNSHSDKVILSSIIGQDDITIGDTTIYSNTDLASFIAVINPTNGDVETVGLFPGRLDTDYDKNVIFIDNDGYIYFSTNHSDSTIINGDTIICKDQDCVLWKVTPQFNIVWYKHISGEDSQKVTGIKVHKKGNVFLSLWCYNLIQLGADTIWHESGSIHRGILQLSSEGDFENTIGADTNQIWTESFTFDGDDLLITGRAISDSIGSWPIDNYFVGKYKLANIGINEFESKKMNVLMYPNPATDRLSVQSSQKIELMELYTINGKLIRSYEVNSNSFQFHVSELKPGCYIIRGITDQNIFSRKLVVR